MSYSCSCGHISLQPPRPFPRQIKPIVVLAYCEPQPVLRKMSILICIKLRGWNHGIPYFHDTEPAQFEISRTMLYMVRPFASLWPFCFREVCENKVSTLRIWVRQPKFIEQGANPCQLLLHLLLTLFPKPSSSVRSDPMRPLAGASRQS
jgi:hypothetical protein